MRTKSLSDFLELGMSDIVRQDANYMIVKVKAFDDRPEIIINPKNNFISKLNYYGNAYNEDLTLKANQDIKIIDYEFIEDLQDYF